VSEVSLNTKRWRLRTTHEPIAYLTIKVRIHAQTLVAYAAEYLTGEPDARVTRTSLERFIRNDVADNGERMDWNYDTDTFTKARWIVRKLYPEWAEWIDKTRE
jgi:hypothetical protein